MVVWGSFGQDGDGFGIYTIIFDSRGNNLTNEFPINNYRTSRQYHPAISALNDTIFVVVWPSAGQDSDNLGVYATIFNSMGKKLTNEFCVNSNTTNSQDDPSISTLNDTTFVVVWSSYEQDGSGYGVYATIFDIMGNNLTNEFRVNSNIINSQEDPSINTLNDTTFVVSWSSYEQDGSDYGVYATVFDSSGTNLTNEFRVNVYTSGNQVIPCVSSVNNTAFIVVWMSDGQDGSSWGIYAIVYNSVGLMLTSEFCVNTYKNNAQYNPTISVLNETVFVISWESNGQDGDNFGIFFKGFSLYSQINNISPPSIPGFEFVTVGFTLLVIMIVILTHNTRKFSFSRDVLQDIF
ncbi:MAG: hypothetical protein EAX96_17905 [Candidatus Lokiarchaeota archaeon]|nr:hypothetical protein [Candidatus Lokiarchaeota archaeon]